MPQAHELLRWALTPEIRSVVTKRYELLLLRIIRANRGTQYASETASLAEFRDAVLAHGSASDTALVEYFRRCVPLSDYESYKPFMAVFDKNPCEEAEIEDLFAPDLPLCLAVSSATSGRAPKVFPKYPPSIPPKPFDFPGLIAGLIFYGYKEVKEVEREPGQIVKKIPVSISSSVVSRAMLGWIDADDDASRMPLIMPGYVAPWATPMIKNHKSYLMTHALFTLACRYLGHISTTFSTIFFDLLRHIDEEWDMLLSSIRNGKVPTYRAHLHANPDRATELREIGPPLSREGWAVHVWPKLGAVTFICSGPFALVLPKAGQMSSRPSVWNSYSVDPESFIAVPHRPNDLDTFVLRSNNVIEFLDVTVVESHENLHQAWELEVGRQYEIVLTTTGGLWRYRLGDVIGVMGFDADDGSPVFEFCGRRNAGIGMLMTDVHIVPAIQAISPDVVQINEFTTVLNDRGSTRTVGYIVELAAALGPNAHLAPARLAEGLASANTAFQGYLESATVCYPTIRIVRPGTFSEYRQWRAEAMNVGPGQVEVPAVLLDSASISWVLDRAMGEI